MNSLKRQVVGSYLVDSVGKLKTLEQLLSVPQGSLQLTTLFATQDKGWDPPAFHSSCDNKGPTLTLVQCTKSAGSQSLYGGYAAASWNSSSQFQADTDAFLFRFTCPINSKKSVVPKKFNTTKSGNELFGHPNFGPVFGYNKCGVDDLSTFNGAGDILKEQQHGSTSSFNLEGQPLIDATDVPKTKDRWRLEVLLVGSIDPAAGGLEAPWQKGVLWSPEVSQHLSFE